MKRFIVKFNGGLGNQMFQYAYAKGVGEKSGMSPIFDMTFFKKRYSRPFELGVFGIKPAVVSDFVDKLKIFFLWKFRKNFDKKSFCGMNFISEPEFNFCSELFDIKPETFIEGFFQTEKYFKHISEYLRKEFTFKTPLDEKNEEVAQKIKSSNSISLHIRRGDYVKKKRYQNMFAVCTLDYYKRAVEKITRGDNSYKLFIFSDDIEWVKQNLELPYEKVYIDFNSGETSYRDMQLMSMCKHNVIANSSFSWWGAWLNRNPEKIVIAPQKWFNDESINQSDIIPENWERIPN